MNPVEEGKDLKLDFGKIARMAGRSRDVIPVAVQNADTREVILVAYTNEPAFRKAIETRTLVLWSTSRDELWEKGQTSGERFDLVEAYVNCEQNSLLYKVRPRRAPAADRAEGRAGGGICHTKNRAGGPRNCYYRRINLATLALENVDP